MDEDPKQGVEKPGGGTKSGEKKVWRGRGGWGGERVVTASVLRLRCTVTVTMDPAVKSPPSSSSSRTETKAKTTFTRRDRALIGKWSVCVRYVFGCSYEIGTWSVSVRYVFGCSYEIGTWSVCIRYVFGCSYEIGTWSDWGSVCRDPLGLRGRDAIMVSLCRYSFGLWSVVAPHVCRIADLVFGGCSACVGSPITHREPWLSPRRPGKRSKPSWCPGTARHWSSSAETCIDTNIFSQHSPSSNMNGERRFRILIS